MDAHVGKAILVGHQLYARANTTSSPDTVAAKPTSYKIIGLVLAIVSGLFIGVSFVLKKHGLLKANLKYNEEAGEGYGYLKNVWWWIGMTLMILGEVCNFAAYLFADAILVTPLGALSVVVTAILSSIFLKERLSFVGKVGCFLCVIGAIVIAANAPEQASVTDIQEMQRLVIAPGFLSYMGVILVGCAFVAFWLGPRYGKKSMLVYLTVCSLIGGLSVSTIQGLGAAITAQARGEAQFNKWFTYVLLAFIICTLVTEVIFLNKALNLFNAALVTPTYYVYFTSATIVTSAVLYQGFKGTPIQILTVVLGFLEICAGVVLLQLSKSAKDVPDTAVFKGDLDQVRTVAEQEEPEYEPRADAIRGGSAILRSFSKARQSRQMEEVRRLHEEHQNMQPIGEHERIEFDGIRRRRTLIGSQHSGTNSMTGTPLSRQKSAHPPLGMSRFPDEHEHEEVHDESSGMHPGFFSQLMRRNRSSKTLPPIPTPESVPLSPVKQGDGTFDEGLAHPRPHFLAAEYTPQFLSQQNADTAYKSPSQVHVQWDAPTSDTERAESRDRLGTPVAQRPPTRTGTPSSTKRQFSFQNVFRKNTDGSDQEIRPVSRGGMSFMSRGNSRAGTSNKSTEEERLGLVKGDTSDPLRNLGIQRSASPLHYSDPHADSPLPSAQRVTEASLMDVQRTALPSFKSSPAPTIPPHASDTIRQVRRTTDADQTDIPAAAARPTVRGPSDSSQDEKAGSGRAFI